MVRQHCPECGTEVPVDDATGVCHVGHRVDSPASPSQPTVSSVPSGDADPDAIDDEPAPWVATVEDDGGTALPEEAPSAAPPPPGPGSPPDAPPAAPEPTPDSAEPVTGFAAASLEADDEPAPFVGGTTSDQDASLEELAAMAAGDTASGHDDTGDDLSSLGDDLRGDLAPTPERATGDDFDLGSLEAAVAELGGDGPDSSAPDTTGSQPAPPTPDLTPQAPGPNAAPDPATAVAEVPQAGDDFDDSAFDRSDDPVAIRPDHGSDEPAAASDAGSAQAPLDPTNFTASGKKVAAPRGGGGDDDEGLVGKLKGLFGR